MNTLNDVTVRDIINIPYLKGFKVLSGGNGLNKKVTTITVLDSPDPFKWSKGGEIVLTSGYIFNIHPEQFLSLVTKLYETGMTALFIKTERYIKKVPEEILDFSNEVGLPIIEVPITYAFKDIINPTLSQIIDSQNKKLKRSQEIMESFTNLVVQNEDTDSILKVMENHINTEVLYYDMIFNKVHFNYSNDNPFYMEFDMDDISKYKDKYKNFNVRLGNKLFGVIFLNIEKLSEPLEVTDFIIKHAITALLLDVQKKISNNQIEERHRNEFVQDLLMHNIKSKEEVFKRSEFYNFEFKGKHKVLIVDIDNFKAQYLKLKDFEKEERLASIRDEIYRISIRKTESYFLRPIYASFSDSLVFILNSNEMDEEVFKKAIVDFSENLKKTISQNFPFTVTIGISEDKDDVLKIDKAFKEAQMSIKIGRILHKGNYIMDYSKLGVFKILYSIYDNMDVKEFMDSKIGVLIEHDEKYSTQFLPTLMTIINNDWNLKKASEEMFLHYNTLKYRYSKIEELMEKDLSLSENRLDLSLAIKIFEMNNWCILSTKNKIYFVLNIQWWKNIEIV